MNYLSKAILIALTSASLAACGGGGGGGGTPPPDNTGGGTGGTGGGGTGGTGGGTGTVQNTNVQEVLDDLGIDTTETPRVDNDGDPLPAEYAPLGSAMAVNKFRELMLFGVPVDDPNVVQNDATGNSMTLTNLVPGSNNSYTWEVLDDPALATTPWVGLGSNVHAVAADVDDDGLDEIVVIYQDGGDVELVVQQDAAENHTLSQPYSVDNGTYSGLFVEAGDFDGDGDADLMLGLVEPTGGAVLRMLDNVAGAFSFNGLSVSIPAINYNISHLVLEAGNFDYDKAYELAVVVNAGTLTSINNSLSNAEHSYLVLDDAGEQFAALNSGTIDYDNGSGRQFAVYGNVAVGDVDGDSLDEIVLAGLNQVGGISSSDPISTFRHVVQVLDDGKQSFALLAEGSSPVLLDSVELPPSGEQYNEGSGTIQAINHVAVVTADVDGDGAAEFLVNQRLFQSLRTSPGALAYYDADDDSDNGPSTIPGVNWYAYNRQNNFNFNWRSVAVAAGDVTLDGRDNIVIYSQREANVIGEYQAMQVWGHDQVNGWGIIREAVTDRRSSVGGQDNYFPQVLLPDSELDDGTAAIKFSDGSHQLVFTQPVLMAALAGAPCATDLGQDLDNSCRTAYGKAVSETTTTTESKTVTGRLFAGFGVGSPVGNNSFELTASISKAINRWTSTAYTLRKSLVYETGSIEDSVILTVVPIDVYTYTVLNHPDPTLVGQEVFVNLSREPITTLVSLDYYNQIVDEDFLRIESDVFAHTVGDPETYPSPAEKSNLLNSYTGLESTETSVGQGTGQTIATIEEFDVTSTGREFRTDYSLDVRATGGGGAYVIGGFSVGIGEGSALETSNGAETRYQGSVGNITQSAFDNGDDYRWGLFTYIYEDHGSGQDFEVLNYWVDP